MNKHYPAPVPCVVCGSNVDVHTGGRRRDGRTWQYFCQGRHTTQDIDKAIMAREKVGGKR